MSRSNLWQFCHKNMRKNKTLTKNIVWEIRRHKLTSKQVARDIAIPTERVRNWFYRSTRMTALDLLCLMRTYDFIKMYIMDMLIDGSGSDL